MEIFPRGPVEKADAVDLLLDSIKCVIDENSITAVVCDKSQKVRNSSYKRLERFKAGKRVVEILKLVQA